MKGVVKMRRYLFLEVIILEKLELLHENASETSINRKEVKKWKDYL
jgi:hypothetical protein